jgi:hypothetical protein
MPALGNATLHRLIEQLHLALDFRRRETRPRQLLKEVPANDGIVRVTGAARAAVQHRCDVPGTPNETVCGEGNKVSHR